MTSVGGWGGEHALPAQPQEDLVTHRHCTRVGERVRAELDIFQKHMAQHKWFRHIDNDVEALASINDEYGPFLRDMFCRHICADRHDCELMLKDLPPEANPVTVVEDLDSCKGELAAAKKKILKLEETIETLEGQIIAEF